MDVRWPQIPKFQLVFLLRLGMYKKMSIEHIGSDKEQVNNWWIDISQLFDQIQQEINLVTDDNDLSNDTQQIEQLSLSIVELNHLMEQIQANAEQELIAQRLREQFEQLKHSGGDLANLKSNVTKPQFTKLDPELYTVPEVNPWQGRTNSINTIQEQEQWRIAWFFAKLFAPLNPDNKVNA
jgi:hypothetical protein